MRAKFRRCLWIGTLAILGCVLLGELILHTHDNRPLMVDASWLRFLRQHQSALALSISQFLGTIGGGLIGGVIIPLVIVARFVLLRRPRSAAFFAGVTLVSDASVVLLKLLFDRPRPGFDSLGDLVGSFPSGHAANAATLVVLLSLLSRRRWLYLAGAIYLPLMMISRTYLAVHWLSDTIGGALVGLGVPLILFGLVGPFLERERGWGAPESQFLAAQRGVSD